MGQAACCVSGKDKKIKPILQPLPGQQSNTGSRLPNEPGIVDQTPSVVTLPNNSNVNPPLEYGQSNIYNNTDFNRGSGNFQPLGGDLVGSNNINNSGGMNIPRV